jgi:hypothetical protein
MIPRTSAVLSSALAIAVSGLAACSGGSTDSAPPAVSSRQAAPASQNPRYLGDDLPLLPPGVAMGVRPVTIMRAAYEFAARHPEVMKFVPCFCGCERGGHKDNHDCFVSARNEQGAVTAWDMHGIGCEVCVDVAYESYRMHNSGATVVAIREAIEKRYASHGGGHTPTPMPSRGGTSHD